MIKINKNELINLYQGILMGDGSMYLREGQYLSEVFKAPILYHVQQLFDIRKKDPQAAEYMCDSIIKELIDDLTKNYSNKIELL